MAAFLCCQLVLLDGRCDVFIASGRSLLRIYPREGTAVHPVCSSRPLNTRSQARQPREAEGTLRMRERPGDPFLPLRSVFLVLQAVRGC